MNPQIEQSLDRLSVQARAGVRRAAATLRDGKKPLKSLSGVGLKLSAVSHRATDGWLRQQTRLAANQIDALADRFASAAAANGPRDLLRRQIEMTPGQFATLRADARDSFAVLAGAGRDARAVIAAGVASLREPAAPVTKKRPAAKKTARRKTAAGTATARKKAPRKKAVRRPAATPAAPTTPATD